MRDDLIVVRNYLDCIIFWFQNRKRYGGMRDTVILAERQK